MALAFLDGAGGVDAQSFAQCARGALDYALGRLSHPDGTLAAAEDATADEYSRYYAWTEAEIDTVLGADSASFKKDHGVAAGGNVPADDDPSSIFAQRNLLRSTATTDASQSSAAARLLAARDKRGAPPRDERATAGAHGFMINALARAGQQLNEPRYIGAARRILDAVRKNFMLSQDGSLRRHAGSDLPADADDYAALALGCRELAHVANDRGAAELSSHFLTQLDSRFYDSASRTYYFAPKPPGPGFFVRPFAVGDPPTVESLAILAGSPNAKALAEALLESLDESGPQAPGEQLLSLAVFGRN